MAFGNSILRVLFVWNCKIGGGGGGEGIKLRSRGARRSPDM